MIGLPQSRFDRVPERDRQTDRLDVFISRVSTAVMIVAYLRGGGVGRGLTVIFLANFALFCALHFATEPYKIRVQRHGRLYNSMPLYRRPCQTRGF